MEKNEAFSKIIWSVLIPIIMTIITLYISNSVLLKQELLMHSNISIDSEQYRQGNGSIRWEYNIQPKKKYINSNNGKVDAFIHFELEGNHLGVVSGVDFSNIQAIKFYAKASNAQIEIGQINLFLGPEYVQYTFSADKALKIDTKWQEFTIPLSDFVVSQWERQYHNDLVLNTIKNGIIDLSNVTAFGFDQISISNNLSGIIWFDYFCLIDKSGNEILFSDADKLQINYKGKKFKWISDSRLYQ